jgi:predicted transcriptional regulator YheO
MNNEYNGKIMDYDSFLSFMNALARLISQMFGTKCEVAISDLEDTEHSVLFIYNGDVTGREVGAPLTADSKRRLKEKDNLYHSNYSKNIPRLSKEVKSSTIVVEAFGHLVSFCINVDCSELSSIQFMLNSFLSMDEDRYDVNENTEKHPPLINSIIEEELKQIKKPVKKLNKKERLSIISNLQKKEIFQMQKSVPIVAEYLCISRYTVYNYLKLLE